MQETTSPVQVIDNETDTFADDLRKTITQGSRLSIAASCFSIYAYQALKKELEQIEELRFIFTSPTFVTEKSSKEQREFYIPRAHRERSLTGSEFEIQLRNELTQKSIAKECAAWIRRKVRFKSNRTHKTMQNFALVDSTSYTPLDGFTTVDLGLERGNNMYTKINRLAAPISQIYIEQFEAVWCDQTQLQDVTDEVVANITNAFKENPPELLYFFTLFNIFRDYLSEISEDVLPKEALGFKDSVVWNKLYQFQKDAALGIISKLEQYKGCILADSVGLGKTFTALSVIKYYELRNKDVLVLCPKKLYDNWKTYNSNYVDNPLADDKLGYTILYHTDLSRTTGTSNGIDLERINLGNYDLVVIDESHNFRNGAKPGSEDADGQVSENRYQRLVNRVIKAGVKTKVLMLSATPVNNRFNDLKNQLQIAHGGNISDLDELLDTESSVTDIFKHAQAEYKRWSDLPEPDRTTEALLNALSFDFFELLDNVTIARSRRHIEQYYGTEEIGRFPERLPVVSRRPSLCNVEGVLTYEEIYKHLQTLKLSVYTPSRFILASKRHKYFDDVEDSKKGLSREGRERGIHQLMCINMLKRLESSIHSFRLTLSKLSEVINANLGKIYQLEQNGVQSSVDDQLPTMDLDPDDVSSDIFVGGKKTSIDLQDMDYLSWREELEEDLFLIDLLLSRANAVTPNNDAKLQNLLSDIAQKIAQPINEGNKKVIVFTAFADTAEYLYENLSTVFLQSNGLHSVLITGGSNTFPSTLKLPGRSKMTFNTALTLFSPRSKNKEAVMPNTQGEIDLLIATDCISEGQNLQDCDYLINYDIHWNPVRLIQRFGRIDRIGSRNKCIRMVNYWPDLQLDEYIDLKARVENRMKVSVMASTGDDNIISNDEKMDLEYRHKQLQRLQTEVVDLEDMGSGISIMDLGLNEFKQDLLSYRQQYGDLEKTPTGLHALLPSSETLPPGVIYILRNINEGVNIDKKNRLHPFYMVYISMEGNVVVNHLEAKKMLDILRKAARGRSTPYEDLCKAFNQSTRDGRKMDAYSQHLGEAIQSIITVKQEQEIDSLFSEGTTTALEHTIKGLDDFELIAFFVIQDAQP